MSDKIVQLYKKVIKGQLKKLARGSMENRCMHCRKQEVEKLREVAIVFSPFPFHQWLNDSL